MKPLTPEIITTKTRRTQRVEDKGFLRVWALGSPPLRNPATLLLNVRKPSAPNLRVLCVFVVNCLFVAFASADGPITLWYQRGGDPDKQRIMQKDLVEPFNAAHPKTPLALDVLAGGTGDKKIRMAVISGKGPDIIMTPGPSTTLALVQSGHLLALDDYIKKYNLDKRILTPVLRTGEYNGHNYA
jgi:ABC-type glycerol-3-phosphate transport system substrate-binding protein